MVSGYIRLDVVQTPQSSANFLFDIKLSKGKKYAVARLRNNFGAGAYKVVISRGEFITIVRNIKDIFTIPQIPGIQYYPDVQLVVSYKSGCQKYSFVNVAPMTINRNSFGDAKFLSGNGSSPIFDATVAYLTNLQYRLFNK